MDAADDDPEQPQLRRHNIASPDRSADIPILSSFLSPSLHVDCEKLM
jgi:hypothetical protein